MNPPETARAAELLLEAMHQTAADGAASIFAPIEDQPSLIAQIAPLIPVARSDHGEDARAAANKIAQLAAGHEVTRKWMKAFAAGKNPADTLKGFEVLPGPGGPIFGQHYQCPLGDNHDWYRFSAATPIPTCPTHQVPLVPAP